MNLFYLISNANNRLAKSTGVTHTRAARNGLTWRGVQIGNPGGSLVLERATECQPFRGRCDTPGWFASAVGDEAELKIRFIESGGVLAERRMRITSESFEPIMLPWPVQPFAGPLDLEIECCGPSAVFIACHFELSRKEVVARCTGTGVELGPGPNPQVLRSAETNVLYVEQKAPEEWAKLYGESYRAKFDPEQIPYYVVGDAHQVPAQADSLDFIFSSHVFEHLANPLGHLQMWSEKLRPGGEVVMVVPDYIGSKDFIASASTIDELRSEFEAGSFEPSLRHYERFARSRGTPGKAKALLDSKTSVHVHFYSNDNMAELLDYAVGQNWFSEYSIVHSRNAKDFHVIAAK